MNAQVDTRPEGGDRLRAPFTGSAVAVGHAPKALPIVITGLGALAWLPLVVLLLAYLVLA